VLRHVHSGAPGPHNPGYHAKYADNLKRELPRLPFGPDFRACAAAGEQLARH
jgi:predicted helicase